MRSVLNIILMDTENPSVSRLDVDRNHPVGNSQGPDLRYRLHTKISNDVTEPITITGMVTNFPATQPVSATSLPLPTGAATSAKQPAIGAPGSASGDVLTVQGITSMTPLKTDGSGFTQPVSGSFFQATQPVSIASMPSTPVTGTFFQATQPVSGTFWQATQPISGSVSVSNFPATQAVTGSFFQATQPVSIASMPSTPVTGTFWQATQPVSGTFFQSTQPVSLTTLPSLATGSNVIGHVIVDSAPVTSVTGPLTDTQLRASAVPVSLSALPALTAGSAVIGHVIVDTAPTTAVTIATLPALTAGSAVIGHVVVDSAPSTAVTNAGTFAVQATLAAETTKVIGTVNQGTSPWVTSSVLTTGSAQIGHLEANQSSNVAQINGVTPLMGNGTTGTGSQRVTIASDNTAFSVNSVQSGTWNIATLTTLTGITNALPTGSNTIGAVTNTNLDVALSTRLKPADTLTGVTTVGAVTSITNALPAGTNQIGSVSLGNATGKTVVMKTGLLTSTATTADQSVLSYTVTAGKTFYLTYLTIDVKLTAVSATGALLGEASLETPSGTKVITTTFNNPTIELPDRYSITFPEPIPVPAAAVIRIVATPAGITSTKWFGSFGGYEK